MRNGNGSQPPLVAAPRLARAGAAAWQLIGIAAAVLLAGWALGRLMPVVLPFTIAVLLCGLLWPGVDALTRRGVPRTVAALACLLGAAAVIAGLVALILPPFVARLGDLGTRLQEGIRRVAYSLGHDVAGMGHASVDRMLDQAGRHVQKHLGGLAGDAITGATALAGVLGTLVLVSFLSFFFLKDGRRLWAWIAGLAPEERRADVEEMGGRAASALAVYAKGVVFVATVDAVFIGIALLVVGVPLALPLIVLTWLAAFFPIVGAVTAGAAAVLVALVSHGVTDALIVLAAIVAVQQIEGNVLYPLVVGPRLRLHPVAVLLTVAAGGTVAGIAGAFLAVPVATVCAAVLEYTRERRGHVAGALPARRGVVLRNGGA